MRDQQATKCVLAPCHLHRMFTSYAEPHCIRKTTIHHCYSLKANQLTWEDVDVPVLVHVLWQLAYVILWHTTVRLLLQPLRKAFDTTAVTSRQHNYIPSLINAIYIFLTNSRAWGVEWPSCASRNASDNKKQ